MKKILILLILITSFSYAVGFGGGKTFETASQLKVDATTIDVVNNMGVYIEVDGGDMDVYGIPMKMGAGLKFDSYFKDNKSGESVSTVITFYGILRKEWELSAFKPYVQFRFGYPYAAEGDYIANYNDATNIYTSDLKGVSYLSLGLGTTISYVDVSVNYDYNNYKLSSNGYSDLNASSGNVSLNLGVRF